MNSCSTLQWSSLAIQLLHYLAFFTMQVNIWHFFFCKSKNIKKNYILCINQTIPSNPVPAAYWRSRSLPLNIRVRPSDKDQHAPVNNDQPPRPVLLIGALLWDPNYCYAWEQKVQISNTRTTRFRSLMNIHKKFSNLFLQFKFSKQIFCLLKITKDILYKSLTHTHENIGRIILFCKLVSDHKNNSLLKLAKILVIQNTTSDVM